ncbi:MAG: DNA mismatch repair endonuclease MutL [Proteobacteria bacterium]|nr:DNA mismatch repair endonuclease MutL [Pseudomonadota bacterium]NDC23121.1 DNA mismatch repair endonuclease MutL [Pseudomonadota bacterium]NDD03922.1 DNA mismatch repair endonuclease MutL [Pseudomonadota bacterium]NDG26027.1 DNA mismatch repair endonuclease MutL [Pseudomonadota bacterium]
MNHSSSPLLTRSAIQRLPDLLINQIAAGEVVERPASVVKELLENSLDSGASRIEIHLKEGGIEEIKVIDNGHGIEWVDLPLAIERHATSKIHQASDLEAIATFGFRGEALSSIASVSHLEVISRTAHSTSGYQIISEFGNTLVSPKVVSAPLGTQITVSQLFQKTPARFKFLRSPQTELSHCGRVIKELALANPGVTLSLRHHDRPMGSWLAPLRKDRFQECFKVSWTPLEIKESREEMTFEALLSPVREAQARSELYLFINNRPVRNRNFISAIRTAYLEMAGIGNEPVGVVYLDIRRDWVDVNVHPQKWEVRCLQQELIYQWLLNCLRKGLQSPPKTSQSLPPIAAKPSTPSYFPAPRPPISAPALNWITPSPLTLTPDTFSFSLIKKTDSLLLAEDSQGFLIAHLVSLRQRALSRSLNQQFINGTWPVDRLEIPKICRLDESLSSTAQQFRTFLSQWGFEIEFYGDGDFAILSAPSFVAQHEVETTFIHLVKQLATPDFYPQAKKSPQLVIDQLIQRTFPKASESYPLEQTMKDLESELDSEKSSPAIFRLTFESLNSYFEQS